MQNRNKKRLLFPSPSVLQGAQRQAQVSDFQSLSKRALGQGAFGQVYKVRHKATRDLYAIKVVAKQKVLQSNLLPQLRRQIRIMYSLSHPHIVKLYNHFQDDKNFYIILQLAQGGTLWQRLAKFKSFDQDTAAQYIREVILAVQYLHSRDPPIIHRDIKPQNLLLDKQGRDGRIKVADFGWSNFFNSERTRMTYCGTLDYLAPQMINQQGHSTKLDLWNIGVLLFELLTGTAPFQANTQAAMFDKILKVRISFPKSFPPLAKDLINRLLRANPEQRLSLEQIMNHPWLQTHAPIRPTLVQQLQREPLPCNLDDAQENPEIQTEDPIKPFEENEYRVLSQPKVQEVKTDPPNVMAPVPEQNLKKSTLETELKQTREENKKYMNNLEDKSTDLQKFNQRIEQLNNALKKLEQDCQEKRDIEKQLKQQLLEKNMKIASMKAVQEDQNKLYQQYQHLRAKSLEKQTELTLLKAEIENLQKMSKQKTYQAETLDSEIQRVKAQIDQAKQKYSKNKSEMHDQFLKLETEVDLLQQDISQRGRDSIAVSKEALLNFLQENLDILKSKYRTQNELLRQYQDANDRLVQLDNKFTEMQLQYESDLSQLKRRTEMEVRELEAGSIKIRDDIPPSEVEALKLRLEESVVSNSGSMVLVSELQHLLNLLEAIRNQ